MGILAQRGKVKVKDRALKSVEIFPVLRILYKKSNLDKNG